MEYTQIDKSYVLGLVRSRIRELEGAHAVLNMRIETPSPGDVVTQQDRDNLQTLEQSLTTLRQKEKGLASGGE